MMTSLHTIAMFVVFWISQCIGLKLIPKMFYFSILLIGFSDFIYLELQGQVLTQIIQYFCCRLSVKNKMILFLLAVLGISATSSATTYVYSDEGHTAVPTNIPTDALTVSLTSNSITVIGDNAFSSLTDLENLYITDNDITTISDTAFFGTQLKKLNLGDNKLSRIPYLKNIASSLLELYLDRNNIICIYASDFQELTVLTKLWIHGNSLTKLPDLVSLLPALDELMIGEFWCCEADWLMSLTLSTQLLPMTGYPCTQPAHRTGVTWPMTAMELADSCSGLPSGKI